VQVAINRLVGGPTPNDPVLANPSTGYPLTDEAQIEAILSDANAYAAGWMGFCGDKVGVIFFIPDPSVQPTPPDEPMYQLIILEVPCVCLNGPDSCGNVGSYYASALVGTPLKSPCTYSIVSGNMPGGLNLDATTGVISGSPTTPGTFSFTAKVVDSSTPAPQLAAVSCSITIISSGCGSAIQSCSITVNPPPTGLGHGDTATIGFWHNKNGQALILSFNGGGTSVKLGNGWPLTSRVSTVTWRESRTV
jgi:hypothetical protein